jgi:hypothetical protein
MEEGSSEASLGLWGEIQICPCLVVDLGRLLPITFGEEDMVTVGLPSDDAESHTVTFRSLYGLPS